MRRASSFEVRLVRESEHEELRRVRLSALAYTPELERHLAEEEAATPDFWRDRAERGASATSMATFVAVDSGEFVGVADGFLTEAGGTAEIGGMWVSPDRRRRGIGRELLLAILVWGRKRGAPRAGLWVRESNEPARRLYESDGFEPSEMAGEGVRLERGL